MRKLLAGLVLITLLLITGCIDSRPPDYSAGNPYAIPDGSGGDSTLTEIGK